METEDDPPMGIPEWVVTFGDMMSLLLTFFIMLVSLSEIKEEEKFQALVESLRQQFGYTDSIDSLSPGESKPRTSTHDVLSNAGRAMRKNTAKGGVPEKAPHGEENHVRIVRPGKQTAIGSVILFEPGSDKLNDQAKQALDLLAEQLRGKTLKIEARGHEAPQIAARASSPIQVFELGFRKSAVVVDYLIQHQKIEAYRFMPSTAGDTEPMFDSGDPEKMGMNSRVEVFLLDETAEQSKQVRGSDRKNAQSDTLPKETN